MSKRKRNVDEQADEQAGQPVGDRPTLPTDRLELAQSKLARMEETNKICFRHRGDLRRIESELQKFNYTPEELDHILEPKGQRNIPGYSFTEMEAQKQFVNRLTSRASRGDSHADALQQTPGQDEGQALG